jgi:glycosyltransferase involved in cell wall biosynthesis
MKARPRLGVFGLGQQRWPSLNRTRRFYREALEGEFALEDVEAAREPQPGTFDALLNFSGSHLWKRGREWECPLLFAMHGGPILDYSRLTDLFRNLQTCDVLLVNCRSDQVLLRELFEERTPHLCLTPLPVDTELFRPRSEAKAKLEVEGAFVLGFVGRLVPQRNLHQFFHLLAELRQRFPGRAVRGLVIGQFWSEYPVLNYQAKTYNKAMQDLAQSLDVADAVDIISSGLTDGQLAQCYAAFDALVHPTNSIDENFGYVAIEAQAAGVPVLGAGYGGLKDTVRDGCTGVLMPTWATPGGIRMDLKRGLDALSEWCEAPGLRNQMGRAARVHVSETYSPQVCQQRLREAVWRALESPRHPCTPCENAQQKPADALPQIPRPWSVYRRPVGYYVSTQPPRLADGTWLRVAYTYAETGDRIQLRDPAWPASYTPAANLRRQLPQLGRWVRVADVLRGGSASRAELQEAVDEGLLIASP